MLLTPAQNLIAEDTHRFRVVNCGRRFGKTTLASEEIKGKAISRPSRIAYIAPTFQQARDIVWEQLKKELAPILTNVNESRLELKTRTLTSEKEESLIVLRGWEAIETLRGQKFDLIIIDEVASMRNFAVTWDQVISPTLTDNKGDAMFISTPKGFNHFYELFNRESTDPDFKSFHFTSYDNPHLPVEELERQKKSSTEDSFAQEYLADFRKTEGLVYKEFDRMKHLFTEDPLNITEVIAGIDFGFTNPTACLTIKIDYDNTFWVTHEWYKTGMTDAQTADYVAAQNFTKVYPDPESPSAIKELKNKRVNIRDVIKNKDSIKNGIQKVRELLLSNKLKIHRSCENLIFEFETYSYPEKKDLHNEQENPIKENDHALDALRYALSMYTGKSRGAKQFIPQSRRTTIPSLHDFSLKTSAQLELEPSRQAHVYHPSFK